eukprot:scaffold4152_cov105-Skeletonema_marinoi.AAC.3
MSSLLFMTYLISNSSLKRQCPCRLLPTNVPNPIRETAARYNHADERGESSSLACSAHGLVNCFLCSGEDWSCARIVKHGFLLQQRNECGNISVVHFVSHASDYSYIMIHVVRAVGSL